MSDGLIQTPRRILWFLGSVCFEGFGEGVCCVVWFGEFGGLECGCPFEGLACFLA